jgi:hypothetical protein
MFQVVADLVSEFTERHAARQLRDLEAIQAAGDPHLDPPLSGGGREAIAVYLDRNSTPAARSSSL